MSFLYAFYYVAVFIGLISLWSGTKYNWVFAIIGTCLFILTAILDRLFFKKVGNNIPKTLESQNDQPSKE